MTKTLEEKRKYNREAQRKYAKSKKGKKAIQEKLKKWKEKKLKDDPGYFAKYQLNRKEYFKKYNKKRREENSLKVREQVREAIKRYTKSAKGKKAIKERIKKWKIEKRKKDPDYFKKYNKKQNDNRKEYFVEYRAKNKEKFRKINREGAKKFYLKTKRVPKYVILRRLRGRLWDTMNSIKINKKISSRKLLGCSIDDFKIHLEKQFKTKMTWENYGKWHIDHIKPVSKFDLTNQEEQKKCFHYTNLQPLWAKENIVKSDKY
ncbi:hypothetical protein OAL77_01805 [Candidatus Pelagibacter sp.]|nr:hypothetical protein [Candidatus Pelagibacter sp.]